MERITRKAILFDAPFFLLGSKEEQPAGRYEIELVEEPLGISHDAYRLVSAAIVITSPRAPYTRQMQPISPALVREAEVRMAATAEADAAPPAAGTSRPT